MQVMIWTTKNVNMSSFSLFLSYLNMHMYHNKIQCYYKIWKLDHKGNVFAFTVVDVSFDLFHVW